MFGLFMPQTELSRVCRPSSKAPTAFDLVVVVCTIVEVITHAIVGEGTATALRHGSLVSYHAMWVEDCKGSLPFRTYLR